MKKLIVALALYAIFAVAAITLGGCSSTKITHATFEGTTFNSASWKSAAGVGGDSSITATTSPTTDASLTGL